jgi:hypothetical protein
LTSKRQDSREASTEGPSDQTGCRPLAGPDATAFGPGLFGDTSPASARRYFALIRELAPMRRLEVVARLSRMVRSSAMLGARERNPELADDELRLVVAELMYGRLEERFRLQQAPRTPMPNENYLNPYSIALLVGDALEALGIPYFVGGSLASGLQGEPRATNDIDMVLELPESQIPALARQLGPDFSVDEEGLKAAVRARRSDNLYFLPLLTKVDIFVRGPSPFDLSEMARRSRHEVEPGRFLWVKSVEDTVLRKLLWFRQGGEASERQWRDITSVLRVAGDSLDSAYLDEWAPQIGIEDLLARARAEVASI